MARCRVGWTEAHLQLSVSVTGWGVPGHPTPTHTPGGTPVDPPHTQVQGQQCPGLTGGTLQPWAVPGTEGTSPLRDPRAPFCPLWSSPPVTCHPLAWGQHPGPWAVPKGSPTHTGDPWSESHPSQHPDHGPGGTLVSEKWRGRKSWRPQAQPGENPAHGVWPQNISF